MKRFLELKKTKKNSQKYKTTELVQIYCQNFNKIIAIRTYIINFLAFFQFFSIHFYLMDPDQLLNPDPGGKMIADPQPVLHKLTRIR